MKNEDEKQRIPPQLAAQAAQAAASKDPDAPAPAVFLDAYAQNPAGILLEAEKEAIRNERRINWFIGEMRRAVETWLDETFKVLMPHQVYNGSNEARADWLKTEGFHVLQANEGLGKFILKHKDQVVTEFTIQATPKSKIQIHN